MKHSIPFILLAFLCLAPWSAYAQTLRGSVRDADNGEPVTGATVALRFSHSGATPLSLATNPEGEFLFEKIRPGYYSVEITSQGYENQAIAEVNVASGKEQILEIALRPSNTELKEVSITSVQPGRRPLLPLGEIPLTREQTLRFPAMYFDPARLATAYPGVVQADDGTNMISIRGNSPSSVRWRLEGVDIVNPNHLPNAGTLGDLPAAASGGILMFSAQLLDNSSLLTGPMPAGYGDALGGVMDMYLRKGNTRQHEFTAQAGLIGLDMAAEGPLGKSGRNAYLVNYRYSTVGLLGQLGVSFGDEQINFQDLSFNIALDGKKGSRWTVFGMGGLSENIFKHKEDVNEIKLYKDFFDIDYHSKTGVIGVSNWLPLGHSTWLKTSIAASAQSNTRSSISPYLADVGKDNQTDESKWSVALTLSQKLSNRVRMLLGFNGRLETFTGNSGGEFTIPNLIDRNFSVLQPWLELNFQSKNNKNFVSLGLHDVYWQGVGSDSGRTLNSFEPRFLYTHKLAPNHRISASFAFQSQTPSAWLMSYDFDLLYSRKAELAYTWDFAPKWSAKAAVFGQWTLNTPFYENELAFAYNNNEFKPYDNQYNYSTWDERNRGVEFNIERRFSDGWFLLGNVSMYTSELSLDNIHRLSTRWDYGKVSNLTFGKEWQREKKPGRERSIGLNARAVWAGGVREADLSRNNGSIDETKGYFNQYPDYFRIDARVYWRKYLGNRRNSTFALDIQNLTGNNNLSYHYYDRFTQKIESKFQLGPIPNFSWRVEF